MLILRFSADNDWNILFHATQKLLLLLLLNDFNFFLLYKNYEKRVGKRKK